ncbi:MAG TPA: hypothetical protein VEG39_12630 [Clostridia bacterium]|nr:hypothetical protein [Clostridia bacterium]
MRNLSEAEMLNLNKLLQAETTAISKARMLIPVIDDTELKRATETSILTCEVRIKGIQQFIQENNIIDGAEVH